jgi:class 3 adenylate cyclase/tetratricopeptide (TPR) repeat protein
MICVGCGEENPDRARFCLQCGTELVGAAAPEAFRKTVTIVFSDVVGSTSLGERLDPETLSDVLTEYFDAVQPVVERHGGTVAKFVGDAVMAVFGIPQSHEDDALRAVRAALEMSGTLADLNPRLQKRHGVTLSVRTGINTGPVVGKGLMPDRNFVSGDTANTAARLQTAADADEILLGDRTYRLVRDDVEARLLPPIAAKGKEALLTAYRLVNLLSEAEAAGRRLRERKTPLVGRDLEKPLLIGTFERSAQQRSVQLVTVVGEPGVGKSRLIGELLTHMDTKPEPTRWLHGRSLPYGEGITFWALGEIVKAAAAILETDSVDIATAKLDAAVPADEPERQWLLRRLAPLVGVESDPPAERQELFVAWRRFVEGLAVDHPTVLVFEDLHWADEALLAFLEYLAEWSQGVPLLVLCAARPELYERRPGWGAGQRNAHTINLSPLTDRETAELVSHLLAANVVDPDLEQAVLERAGGNPLYAEEFIRLLVDQGIDTSEAKRAEAALPESVQALIAARLDTLTPSRKGLLQDAAVLGTVFWVAGLAEMGGTGKDEVELAVHELARKELVRPHRSSSMAGQTEYSFRHLLVRDVAYEQIPRPERARRHCAAATWIEGQAGDRIEDLAEVLAHHYLQAHELLAAAGEGEKSAELAPAARRFLTLAGERALGLDTAQAEARFSRALDLTGIDDPERPDLLVRWADAALQGGRIREAADALDDAVAALRVRGDAETTADALQFRSRAALRLGEGRHVELAAEAVSLLSERPPSAAIVAAYAQLANAYTIAGACTEAVAAADRAVEVTEDLGLPEPARALGYRGFARVYLGDADGLSEMERALAMLVERGAGRDAAVLQNNLALARYPFQGPARSLAEFEAAISFCEQRGLAEATAILATNCPSLLVELARADEALERADGLAPTFEARSDLHNLMELRAVQVTTRLARGDLENALEAADWLLETAATLSTADGEALGLGAAAAALVRDDPERARLVLEQLARGTAVRTSTYYARQLSTFTRLALLVDDEDLTRRLAEGLVQGYPLNDNAQCTVRALLAEHAGDHSLAATTYREAAERWRAFGNVPEQAHSLLGEGRCLLAAGLPGAQEPLGDAHAIFAQVGYKDVLETTHLLEQTTASLPGV